MAKAYLSIENVGVTFTKGAARTEVLSGVDLKVEKGEFVSIIGHSGCGKSTLLNVVAGLTPVTTGAVILDKQEVNAPGPDRAVVFQNHSLLPWLSVRENVSLAVDKVFGGIKSAAERRDWTLHNLELVKMTHALDKRPSEISGGMKQRVGIARALSMEPKVLLLDEPFGALDATVRKSLRKELRRVHDATGVTTIFVTHDQEEALELADRVAILNKGSIEQIGTPDQVHDTPQTAFVCGFVGEANCFEGKVGGGQFNAGLLRLPAGGVREGSATAYVRPHDFVLDDSGFEVRVERAHVQGALTTVNATALDGRPIEISASRAEAARFQGTVKIAARKAHVYAA